MRRMLPTLLAVSGLVLLIAMVWAYLATATAVPIGRAGGNDQAAAPGPKAGGESGSEKTGDELIGYTRTDDGAGNVTIEATLVTPGSIKQDPALAERALGIDRSRELGVAVGFLTHSVELGDVDMVASSLLTTANGEQRPLRWQSLSDDSHHRSGTLVFDLSGVDLGGQGRLTLTVKEVAGVPVRTFTWALPLP